MAKSDADLLQKLVAYFISKLEKSEEYEFYFVTLSSNKGAYP